MLKVLIQLWENYAPGYGRLGEHSGFQDVAISVDAATAQIDLEAYFPRRLLSANLLEYWEAGHGLHYEDRS